ncbi:hypothetical protein [Moorella sulfitireducens (nom. illeg.)]|uniref:hypothetical protein n=1 Tax=Neomoorella sulfitireducens TaxID=2972948 RepID=UPI0021AC2072|nr:hypothetical protein [Moorella sulfitireducens]
MKIFVNDREWANDGELVKTLAKNNQVVKSIKIDGQEYAGTLEQALNEKQVREIRLETGSLAELLEEVKISVKQYLPIVRDNMLRVGRFFQTGREEEAFSMVVQIIDGLEWLIEAFANINLAEPGFLPEERITTFKDKLQDLLKAWENRDYVLVGDLFEYELVPFLDEWEAALREKNCFNKN